MHMERLFFSRLDCDFQNPHLFVLKDYAMIVRCSRNCIVGSWRARIFFSKKCRPTNKKRCVEEKNLRNLKRISHIN